VIGGVITSTLLTLLVIPTVYEILDNFRSWMAEKVWRRIFKPHREPAATPAASAE
jgi:HAE1 family hydrophobic/amphiphilic exporter-1